MFRDVNICYDRYVIRCVRDVMIRDVIQAKLCKGCLEMLTYVMIDML